MPHLQYAVRFPLRYANAVRKLRWADVFLLARMVYLLAKLLILQSRRPLPVLMAMFDSAPGSHLHYRMPPRRLVRLVDALMRLTFGKDYCMKRSILLFHFLRAWGYDAVVHFGVTKTDGVLKGHAWVDLNGWPLAERKDPRTEYIRTFSYPSNTGMSDP